MDGAWRTKTDHNNSPWAFDSGVLESQAIKAHVRLPSIQTVKAYDMIYTI